MINSKATDDLRINQYTKSVDRYHFSEMKRTDTVDKEDNKKMFKDKKKDGRLRIAIRLKCHLVSFHVKGGKIILG